MKKYGFYIALYGNVLILLWLGVFKFTATEANAIVGLVKSSPFMSWLYNVMSVQQASNVIGSFEVVTAVLLASFPFSKKMALWGAVMNTIIYLGTISFLFTTPGMFKVVDGIWVAEFFIIKDIVPLGIGLMVIGKAKEKESY